MEERRDGERRGGARRGRRRKAGRLGVAGLAIATSIACYPHWGPISYSTTRLFDRDRVPQDEVGSPPLLRLGGLPHPYFVFPIRIADPDRLGEHKYLTLSRPPLRFREHSGGIVYTRRGGFLDIAHLRNTSDLVRYAHDRVLAALRAQRDEIVLVSSEPSFYRVSFDLAAERAALPAEDLARLEEEIAIRLAQRLGFFMTTWHEILTFYGYRSGVLVPEHQSAFVWDDQPSHMVGALAAGQALRRGGDFDTALSEVVREWMSALDARSPEETKAAVSSVEGTWWRGVPPLRLVHLGVGEDPMVPFVPPGDPAGPLARWHLPTLEDVAGRDLRHCCLVRIDPRTRAARPLYAALETEPRLIEPDRDFPRIEAAIRADQPDIAVAVVGGRAPIPEPPPVGEGPPDAAARVEGPVDADSGVVSRVPGRRSAAQ